MSKEEDIAAAEAALAAAKAEPDAAPETVTEVPVAPVVEPEVAKEEPKLPAADTQWLEATVRLNKARPYGTVMPVDGKNRFFQDGKYFDYAGELVEGQ